MKRFVFDLVPFEKEITALDGKKAKITAYGKVINVIRFDNDETKPIQKIQVLEVFDIEGYSPRFEAFAMLRNFKKIVSYPHVSSRLHP